MQAKRCDRCGGFYEAVRENVYQLKVTDPETGEVTEYPINSVRIGYWDQRKKGWRNIASAYDLCEGCAKEIADVIFAGPSKMKMRMKTDLVKHDNETDDGK